MFQSRLIDEVLPLIEVSFATLNPGAVTAGSSVVVNVAATLGSVGSSSPATFTASDVILMVFPLAGTATIGLRVTGSPSATAGTANFSFKNDTNGTITPTSGPYKIVAVRTVNTLVS